MPARDVAVETVLLALKIAFLVLLYLFIWRIVRTASRDLRLPQESFVLAPPAQAAGLAARAAAARTGRLVVVDEPVARARPRPRARLDRRSRVGRGAQNDLALDGDDFASSAPRALRAAPRRRLGRGHRLDERHLRERRPDLEARAARARRRRPRRRDRPPVRAMTIGAARHARRTPAPQTPRGTRTPTSASRRCSPSPTAWAARRPARSPRGSPRRRSREPTGTTRRAEAVVELIQEANRRVYERAAATTTPPGWERR